jgi:hypothetical protein
MSTDAISPLRQRMIEDMSARKLNPHTQSQPHHDRAAFTSKSGTESWLTGKASPRDRNNASLDSRVGWD